jgi:hypothetical protein
MASADSDAMRDVKQEIKDVMQKIEAVEAKDVRTEDEKADLVAWRKKEERLDTRLTMLLQQKSSASESGTFHCACSCSCSCACSCSCSGLVFNKTLVFSKRTTTCHNNCPKRVPAHRPPRSP